MITHKKTWLQTSFLRHKHNALRWVSNTRTVQRVSLGKQSKVGFRVTKNGRSAHPPKYIYITLLTTWRNYRKQTYWHFVCVEHWNYTRNILDVNHNDSWKPCLLTSHSFVVSIANNEHYKWSAASRGNNSRATDASVRHLFLKPETGVIGLV